ncbi:DUF4129 domain-containing protein [Chloroflexota bacterium]
MKRLAISILVTVLFLAIFPPLLTITAQPAHIPHENPAAAKESANTALLLVFYGNVFDRATYRQYQTAHDMLDELKQANIPPSLQFIVERYNELSHQLFRDLDQLESLLNEASDLLAVYRIDEARQRLDDARSSISSSQIVLEDILLATAALGEAMGMSLPQVDTQLSQAYNRLQIIIQRISQLISELNLFYERLVRTYETELLVELTPTELSLETTPGAAFVGDTITASGRLTTSSGNPLDNRGVNLSLGRRLFAATTDPDGFYTIDITLPYRYVSPVLLSASFNSSGDDIGAYLGSRSPVAEVTTYFHPTQLSISPPPDGRPGLPMTISGQISSTSTAVERVIQLSLGDTLLAEETVRDKFAIPVTPPPQIPGGVHNLEVRVAPNKRYADASASRDIAISRIGIEVAAEVPLVVVLPKTMKINGRVYHSSGPLPDASVEVSLRGSSTRVRTAADGTFTATLAMPLDISLVSPQQLTIAIKPDEPYYAGLGLKKTLYFINAVSVGLLLVAFVSLGLLAYNRARIGPTRRREEVEETVEVIAPTVPISPEPASTIRPPRAPRPGYDLTGISGDILSAYLSGLEAVENASGIMLLPHTTLREFIDAVTPVLPGSIASFAALTTLAEIALYSGHRLDKNMAAQAKQLAATALAELQSGTA